MHKPPTRPLLREQLSAARLMAEHPPQLHHAGKIAIREVAWPEGTHHSGHITLSRWPTMRLPDLLRGGSPAPDIEWLPGVFDYPEPPADGGSVQWHLNFADAEVFGFYDGPLFAQDEIQVAEHPALAAVREWLRARRLPARTLETGVPTPVLVAGVERRCRIDTSADPAHGRSQAIYGSRFAQTSVDVIRGAVTVLAPPTVTNVVAIAAPAYGCGRYEEDEIQMLLDTAYTGFRAARLESEHLDPQAVEVVIHTGFWGCGAFGGNRVLTPAVQLLAARLAGIHRLVFHTGDSADSAGTADFEAARTLAASVSPGPGQDRPVVAVVEDLTERAFEWSAGDGN
jgi:hypothetical protein